MTTLVRLPDPTGVPINLTEVGIRFTNHMTRVRKFQKRNKAASFVLQPLHHCVKCNDFKAYILSDQSLLSSFNYQDLFRINCGLIIYIALLQELTILFTDRNNSHPI